MSTFTKVRFAIALFALAALGAKAQAQTNTIVGGSGSFGDFWANAGGANYQQNFNYNLFNSNLGTLTGVEFCLTLKGRGDWMADIGGEGKIPPSLDITLIGGQGINVDGGNGWLGAGWVPVINNYEISSTVFLDNVQTPFWIMSPDDGPSFSWADQTSFDLPNIGAFIGTGTDSATFSSYALIDYFTNPNSTLALEGHDYKWEASWQLKYTYVVPEPGSAILLGTTGMMWLTRRRRPVTAKTV